MHQLLPEQCDPSDWYIEGDESELGRVSSDFVPVPLPIHHLAVPQSISFSMPSTELIDTIAAYVDGAK